MILERKISINDPKRHRINSPQETANLAKTFAPKLSPGDVVAFYGDLGSGKTFMIKHICAELQAIEEPTSPSFTLINEYHTPHPFTIYHFDFYRLEHETELMNLGIEDFLYGDNICLIEWADKIEKYLPSKRYDIFIKFGSHKPDAREIEIYQRS